jgi:hypothetical protein
MRGEQVRHDPAVGRHEWGDLDHLRVAGRRADPIGRPEEHRAPRHASRQIPARRANDDDRAARHVLAGVIADALHHG